MRTSVRRSLVVAVAGAVALAAAAAFAPRPAPAADDDPSFDGWIVEQDGVSERFAASDGWSGTALRDAYRLSRIQETVSFYGCFRVERAEPLAPDHARQQRADPGDGWTVRQAGVTRGYPRTDGWVGRANPDGFYLERRGRTVWYYGTFRAVERPRDDRAPTGR